ncbi:spherulin-2A-like [Cydia fagiglandana]|uniref:spherulin-2A-like n=1 Tax=Cydia fagiglandana TaxID=1458189 RepID=UPI002FEE584D
MLFQTPVLLLIVPLMVEARLTINITVASHKKDIVVKTSGADLKLITDQEIQMFNFTDLNVNRGFRIELGKIPDNYFLKDPTLYDDLFKQFEWDQVRRKVYIKNIDVQETVSSDVVLKVHKFINNSTAPMHFNMSSYVKVENVIYSSWSKTGVPDDDIYYDLIIHLNNNHFQYANKWRDDQIRSRYLNVGLTEKGQFVVDPYTSVTMRLSAHQTIVLVKIVYAAFLTGQVIGDYQNLYGKYHFYAPSVKHIMKAASLKNEIITTELVEIRCFTTPKLDLFDENGSKVNIVRLPVALRTIKKSCV